MSRAKRDARKKSGSVPVWVWVLVAIAVLPTVGLRVALKAFKNPSGSMAPTLLVGDHLFMRRWGSTPPPRGEVIVFAYPENRQQDFIKRVIALPGETLEALDGRPVINGWLAPHCHVGPYPYEGRDFELYLEYLGDRAYGTLFDAKLEERACKADAECGEGKACRGGACGVLQGPFHVAPGEVWVMGDNRNNSHDSRMWRGGLGAGLPFDDIHGGALVIWMSEVGGRVLTSVQGPPVLPPAAASLQAAVDKCLRDRPPREQTTPPRG